MSREPLLPGSTIGVLGSGQLGRMLALEARRLGYRIHTFSPGRDTPTGQVADREVSAPYDDLDAVREFASRVGVVTFEFENVPAATAEAAAASAPVRPAHRVLHTTQDRLREKRFLTKHGFPVTPFREVRSRGELAQALSEIGAPAVLKTAGWGYDGKGQSRIEPEELDEAREETLEAAWDLAGETTGDSDEDAGSPDESPRILEAFVDFERELSVVAARGLDGAFAHFGVLANDHVDHILDLTRAPAPVTPQVARDAEEIARGVLEKLDVVGVLCVEMFLTRGGRLLVNELAPRPHNSGHLTLDAHVTSQFEQQLRAVCGLPLGSTEQLRPAAMANLMGDLWFPEPQLAEGRSEPVEPCWAEALAVPGVRLHLYGKKDPRPGRKMGHLTALGETVERARETVLRARAALGRSVDGH